MVGNQLAYLREKPSTAMPVVLLDGKGSPSQGARREW